MSVGRPLLETGEEKEDRPVVSSPGFFQVPSLTEMCMDELLSREHRMDKEYIKQSVGRLDEYKQFKQKKLKSLLEAILWGDPKKTLELIDQYPALLLEKLEEKLELNGVEIEGEVAEAPSGHKTTNMTAYRLALAVEDTELAAEIKARLVVLAGEEAAAAQWQEQFPKDWEAAEEKAWDPIFEQLERLTQAIRHVAPGDIVSSGSPAHPNQLTVRKESNLDDALKRFRSLLDSKLNEILTTGRQFNPQLLLKAYRIYENYYSILGGMYDPRTMLFWQLVIGYIQRSLPANYIQAFIDDNGIGGTEMKLRAGWLQNRSLKFGVYDIANHNWVPSAISFYPLLKAHPNFNFVLHNGNAYETLFGLLMCSGRFEAYVNQKQQACRSLCSTKTLTDPRRDFGVP